MDSNLCSPRSSLAPSYISVNLALIVANHLWPVRVLLPTTAAAGVIAIPEIRIQRVAIQIVVDSIAVAIRAISAPTINPRAADRFRVQPVRLLVGHDKLVRARPCAGEIGTGAVNCVPSGETHVAVVVPTMHPSPSKYLTCGMP